MKVQSVGYSVYQATMVLHGIGVLVYSIGFVAKNFITVLQYKDLVFVGSVMMVNGVVSVGLSVFYMVYVTYKIHHTNK